MTSINKVKELLAQKRIQEAYQLAVNLYDKNKQDKNIILVLADLVFNVNPNAFAQFHGDVGEYMQNEPNYLLFLGLHLLRTNNIEEADIVLSSIYENFKRNANFNINYASCKIMLGDKESAEKYLNKARMLEPNNMQALAHLADLTMSVGKDSEAIALYTKVISADKSNYGALNNMGNCYKNILELESAIKAYNDAIAINPGVGMLWTNLVHCESYIKEDLTESLRRFNKEFQPRNITEQFYNIKDLNRKIRIGFVSPDFRSHSVNYFIMPLFENYDRRDYEFYIFVDQHYCDSTTEKFKTLADNFTLIAGMPDEQVKAEITKQQIDIIIDLSLHSGNNRLSMFRDYLAPIQISYIGCNVSPGLDSMTGRLLSDPLITDLERDMSVEPLISLGESSIAFEFPLDVPVRPEISAFERNGYITFGSFSYPSKFSPVVFNAYAEILKQVPDSKLYLKYKTLSDIKLREKVVSEFKLRDILEDRLIIEGFTEKQLEEYFNVDVCLDVYPYGNTTTLKDVLKTSTPFLSLSGNCANSRQGLLFANCLDLTEEFIGFTPEEFVSKAVRLANDKDKIKFYHKNLAEKTKNSSLCDVMGFTDIFCAKLRELWVKFCSE